ncbi:MAG: HD domain-containing protein [Candidatus Korobacteraceae bacterium]
MNQRLEQQLSFILEIDKLKTVLRQTLLTDASRRENSAEHSWHLAIMAPLLAEYATAPVDVCRVIKMLLVHDLVEIDAGDTFAYDAAGNAGRAAPGASTRSASTRSTAAWSPSAPPCPNSGRWSPASSKTPANAAG